LPRDSETIKELETAEAFLAKGLVRNAAGKVFQALKAFTSYLALKNAALLTEKYRGQVGRTAVPLHEWVAAVAPTGRLLEMVTLLKKAVSKITEPNTLASQLRIATTARPRWRKK
jgi:hypothetical protein